MGTIKVGQKSPKTVDMGGFTIAPNNGGASAQNNGGMSAEAKAKKIEEIMQLPKEQIVPELRKHGFTEIADITEAQIKKYEAETAKENARENRLAEIKAMPEEEQLPLLLAEGFEDEAKELSEKLALEQQQQEQTGEGSGEENHVQEEVADGCESELNTEGEGDGTTAENAAAPENAGDAAPADAAPAEPEKKPKTHKAPKAKK